MGERTNGRGMYGSDVVTFIFSNFAFKISVSHKMRDEIFIQSETRFFNTRLVFSLHQSGDITRVFVTRCSCVLRDISVFVAR